MNQKPVPLFLDSGYNIKFNADTMDSKLFIAGKNNIPMKRKCLYTTSFEHFLERNNWYE